MDEEGDCSVHSTGTLALIGPKFFSVPLPELPVAAETGSGEAGGASGGGDVLAASGCVLQPSQSSDTKMRRAKLSIRLIPAKRCVPFIP
jgi:hypothetical protein